MSAAAAPPAETREAVATLLADLCADHSILVPKLEWSTRMRRMLGRAYMDSGTIRLSSWLEHNQALDTLRHELAHIAVGKGRHAPHGPKWREWAVRLGVEPRATARKPPANAESLPSRRRYSGLECGNCGARFARSRVIRSLYHKDCGPRQGKLLRVLQGDQQKVFDWVASGKAGDGRLT